MIFIKKFSNFKKKMCSFYFITFNFLMLLLLHKTLIGSRNIQGFALIRAVLFSLILFNLSKTKIHLYVSSICRKWKKMEEMEVEIFC